MIRFLLKPSYLSFLFIPLIACNWNRTSPSTAWTPEDSSLTANIPDTVGLNKDSLQKVSVMTDTSWKQAVQKFQVPNKISQSSQPGEVQELQPDPPKKKIPPTMVNPFRPPILLEGLKKAQAGDLRGAIQDFDSAIMKNPKNYNAYFYRSKARIETGNSRGALEDINKAIENFGNEALYFYYRGKLLSDMGESDKAIADFSQAIKLKSNFTDAWNYRGVEKAKLDKHQEALLDYDSAIAFNPSYALTFYNRGTSLASLGQFQAAIESFSKAVSIDGKHTLSFINRGNCNVQLKQYKAAIADYNRALEIEPKNTDALYNRGAAHYLAADGLMCPDWKKAAALGNTRAKSMVEKYCK